MMDIFDLINQRLKDGPDAMDIIVMVITFHDKDQNKIREDVPELPMNLVVPIEHILFTDGLLQGIIRYVCI